MAALDLPVLVGNILRDFAGEVPEEREEYDVTSR